MSEEIKSYKGTDKDMKCLGFQYEVGKTYETDDAEACKCGFHACEAPLDVWNYYSPADGSRYFEVKQSGKISRNGDDSKVASSKMTVGAEIGIPGLVKAHIEYVKEKTRNGKTSSGNWAKIGSSGNWAKIGSSGDGAKIGSSGDGAKIGSSGYGAQIGSSGYGAKIGSIGHWAQIGSSGNWAQIGSSGYGAQIGSSGNWAKIGSIGNWAQIGSSGYGAQIGSSGDGAQIGSIGDGAQIGSSGYGAKIGSSGRGAKIEITGEGSVVACIGVDGCVKAALGSWITLAEYGEYNGRFRPCLCVRSAKIDGETLKPDVWYQLKNGEFEEVTE